MSTPDGVRTRDPDRRVRILRSAASLLAERGFHGVSMADIGGAAGIVGSGVYRHFDSKSAVLVALLDEVMDRLLQTASENQQSVAGVSLDEETANLLVLQRSYQGAARIMSAVDDMISTVINMVGR